MYSILAQITTVLSAVTFVVTLVLKVAITIMELLTAFVSAISCFISNLCAICVILGAVIADLICSALSLSLSLGKFVVIVIETLISILVELSPIFGIVANILWAIVSSCATVLLYIIMLPVTFDDELRYFLKMVASGVWDGLKRSALELHQISQVFINQKDIVLMKLSETMSQLIGLLSLPITFLWRYILSVYTLITSYISGTFTILSRGIRHCFIVALEVPRSVSHPGIVIILLVIGAASVFWTLYKSKRRVARQPMLLHENDDDDDDSDLDLDPPIANEWESDDSDSDDYALFGADCTAKSRASGASESSLPADAVSLQRLLEDERDQRLCVVCQDRAKSIVLLPCRHMCLCQDCAREITHQRHQKLCPLCRNRIDKVFSVFT